MPGLLPDVDADGLLEYSVVYTDRALNHMSAKFQGVMRDISSILRDAYGAAGVAVVPGSGSFGMEAVARQFATGRRVLVIRNGWFSFRWSQLFEMGGIPAETTVLQARRQGNDAQSPYAPPPIDEVVATIERVKPELVFAPHVETASGMVLPHDYLRAVGEAVHRVGGMFVLDCIASGAVWVDMRECAVDVLISAPQKGWSGSPCAGFVMLGETALERIAATTSTSFACDLKKWLQIMQTYEGGGHAYHATLPTDALLHTRDAMRETQRRGFQRLCEAQWALGRGVRAMLERRGFPSVAAEGFQAPGVVVSYTTDPELHTGRKLLAQGVQIAGGVPLQCGEGPEFKTFRIGLFGLDKWHDVEGAVRRLEQAFDAALA
ncbi:alanine--glyoxylate aminotransferase family protein [Azohydromonas caseinilytica]|uniref:Alanine--glyoxylate aminotransferase family protein n=1 Tax=Azohydromonas caseinilytica TaxID=2728836 RepID=A0A848FCM9_9BURK|nr:alanine--glyoxylate aminotransferase family protein [Azohydromonas caseinilytica]NML15711.1 alanine--glyoxylate aminotransferase family protein [Azohydromonas caseinilytica]